LDVLGHTSAKAEEQGPVVTVKNTFLHVQDTAQPSIDAELAKRESTSDPSSSRSSSRSSRNSSESMHASDLGSAHRLFETSSSSSKDAQQPNGPGTSRSKGFLDERDVERSQEDNSDVEKPVGSSLHPSGRCKPCRFVLTRRGCTSGDDCKFCHLPHDVGEIPKRKARPGKTTRDSFKKFCAKQKAEIAHNPLTFDPSMVKVPHYIQSKPRLVRRLDQLMEQTFAASRREHDGQGAEGHLMLRRGNVTLYQM